MGINITYMGTKRALASAVSEVISSAQAGTVLDAFSGMCSVGEAIGTTRQIWNNDIQVFASYVAKSLFVSRDPPLSALTCGDIHFEAFKRQQGRLSRNFAASIALENDLLETTTFKTFTTANAKLAKALRRDIVKSTTRSAHLFTTTYSGSYFGIRQAIEIDAVVYTIRESQIKAKLTVDEARWCVVALGRALLKIANSTGHFAQYLTPKASSYRRYLALRRRTVWSEWLSSLADMSPIGDASWRKSNKAYNQDSLKLLPRLANGKAEIGVIYADPPYTDDQYSRFYHLLETLCLYDYPKITGKGLYRSNRFQTPFSLTSKAAAALEKLIASASRTEADLVLSYPTNGLVRETGTDPRTILRKYFRRVEICHSMAHRHSTFGASKGSAHTDTTELIYLARSG